MKEVSAAAGSPHSKYRADIDGLRAIAVLAVVGFHAFPTIVKGGFIGVDIFFVISGYLISTIILERLASETFSFLEFYTRRVRRIFPALLVVLIAVLIVGRYALLPDEFKELGRQTAAGAAFVSNLLFWSESGYFDNDAIRKPLLHLWSLGIEEQYYIAWPVLLWALRKKRLGVLFITSIGVASFVLSVWQAHANPVAAFYSPLTRFFELFIGSGLAYLTLRSGKVASGLVIRSGNVRALAGAALLGAGLVLITNARAFPGVWALLPTVGTALLVSAGADAWLNRAVLANRALVWIGGISFPLYLWHWPILSFATIIGDEFPSRTSRAMAVVSAVPLAWLTYHLVERPVRFGPRREKLVRIVLALMVALGLAAFFMPSVLRPALSPAQLMQLTQLSEVSALKDDMKKMYGEKSCMRYAKDQTVDMFIENGCVDVKHPDLPTAFLIGDSHSGSLAAGLRPLIEARNFNFLQVSTGWCEPTSTNEEDQNCEAINAMVRKKVAEIRPEVVIFDSNWLGASAAPYYVGSEYTTHLASYLTELLKSGAKKVFVVGQIPTWKNALPAVLIRKFVMRGLPIPERTYEGVQRDSLALDSRMRVARFPEGVTYLSVKDALCDDTGCLTAVGPDLARDLLVWDYGHLTPQGAAYVAKKLFGDTRLLSQ